MLSRADFNCPGNREMTLDGRAAPKDDKLEMKGIVHLDKISQPDFEDEWDFVIDNYITGANDPDIIDSIAAISSKPVGVTKKPAPIAEKEKSSVITKSAPPKPAVKTAHLAKNAEPVKEPSIEEKFVTRQKRFVKEIPVSGDSIELRFYDNAEIDGDSISLFLNDKLIFEHIRLTGNAFIFKIPVNELKPTNELTMVAENMGTIPPNTSYMVAIVNEIRYDAYLASTEGSSAMIRFTKK